MKYEVSIQNAHLLAESHSNGLALLDTGNQIYLSADHLLMEGIRANTVLPFLNLLEWISLAL